MRKEHSFPVDRFESKLYVNNKITLSQPLTASVKHGHRNSLKRPSQEAKRLKKSVACFFSCQMEARVLFNFQETVFKSKIFQKERLSALCVSTDYYYTLLSG